MLIILRNMKYFHKYLENQIRDLKIVLDRLEFNLAELEKKCEAGKRVK